ncbi:MAG: GFA family protein [Robiginitomaculum sp.]
MAEDAKAKAYTGKCYCGAVRFEAKDLSDIWYCHCTQCQHLTGHIVAAAGAAKENFSYTGDITWSAISENTQAGHCAECASYLFWDYKSRSSISVLVGNVDDTNGLKEKGHIFVSEKKGYFEITDGLPQYDTYPPEGTR